MYGAAFMRARYDFMNSTGRSYRTPRRSLAAALLTPSPRMNRSGKSSLRARAALPAAIGSRL